MNAKISEDFGHGRKEYKVEIILDGKPRCWWFVTRKMAEVWCKSHGYILL